MLVRLVDENVIPRSCRSSAIVFSSAAIYSSDKWDKWMKRSYSRRLSPSAGYMGDRPLLLVYINSILIHYYSLVN